MSASLGCICIACSPSHHEAPSANNGLKCNTERHAKKKKKKKKCYVQSVVVSVKERRETGTRDLPSAAPSLPSRSLFPSPLPRLGYNWGGRFVYNSTLNFAYQNILPAPSLYAMIPSLFRIIHSFSAEHDPSIVVALLFLLSAVPVAVVACVVFFVV